MLTNFWETTVPKGHKHFVNTMDAAKIRRLNERVKKNFIDNLDFENIKIGLDWGCGGGLHTKTLSKLCKIIPLDISQESLSKCETFSGISGGVLIPNNFSQFDTTRFRNIDLIFCADVIHHFPNLKYFKDVCQTWNKIYPKYICAQFKISRGENIDNPNYFKQSNYIHSLLLEKNYVKSQFKNYSEISYGIENGKFGKIQHGFIVLKRNDTF